MREAQEQLSQHKEVILEKEHQIKAKSEEANLLAQQNNEAQLRIKELEHNISKHNKDSADAAARVTSHTYLRIRYTSTLETAREPGKNKGGMHTSEYMGGFESLYVCSRIVGGVGGIYKIPEGHKNNTYNYRITRM